MSLPVTKEPASCNVANLSSMLQQPIQKLRRAKAPIEKEMLSVVFGLTGFHTSTYGRQVTVNNDHKPLAAILKRPGAENLIRLQRMLCRITGCDLHFK